MAAAKPSALVDTRVVYCGDNLDHLARLPAHCVDLIYIDPPFNSNRNYETACPARTFNCVRITMPTRRASARC